MKKTKLLTSLAALALVLSLGACEENADVDSDVTIGGDESSSEAGSEEESASENTSEDDTKENTSEDNTSESSSEGDTTPEPTAYAIVGDFVDSSWDNEPATDSKYFIPAETEEFKVTITTAGEPIDNEWWSEDNQWDAGLSVVEYGTWNRVAGYTELDKASTGVKGSSDSNDVSLAWNTVYDVTLTFGETNSILVELVEETYDGDPVADLLADVKENNNYSLTIEYYDWSSPTYGSESGMYQDFENDTISKNSERHYNVVITFTKDVMFIEYYYGTSDGSVYDIESYINSGDDMEVWWCSTSYSTTLVKQTTMTETNQSWQNKWKSETLLGLDDSIFVVDASSYDGSKIDYTVDIDSYATLTSLVDCLYHCANYYAEGTYANNITPFIYNLQTYWNTYGAPTVKSTYDLENEEWDTTMYYLEENVTKVNETTNEYQLKYHGATAYISDVGSTELAEIYASQLPIFAN